MRPVLGSGAGAGGIPPAPGAGEGAGSGTEPGEAIRLWTSPLGPSTLISRMRAMTALYGSFTPRCGGWFHRRKSWYWPGVSRTSKVPLNGERLRVSRPLT